MKEDFLNIRSVYLQKFGKEPHLISRAPGRVNLLGEHIDYNDGLVLPVAIDRTVHIAASARHDQIVHLVAEDLGQDVTFSLENLELKIDIHGIRLPNWAHYPAGVAWSLQEAGMETSGFDAVFSSNVPIGAGLSSSAAVEVGFAVLWQKLGGWKMDRMTLAKRCQRAENAYVGVSCGLMDQFASAHGVAGHAMCFDTRSLDWEAVPLPLGMAIVIADSGVRRSLTNSAYNERRSSCEKAVEILKQYLPDIQSLRDVPTTVFAAYSDRLPPNVRKRAEHVVREIARVESAVTALARQDTRTFGALMNAGHTSLRDLYEVSTPELDSLVEIAQSLPGCAGARLTGAGFGGCTVNLVEENLASTFIDSLKKGYFTATLRTAQVYLCQASEGAATFPGFIT
jgi:galactokinase